MSVARHAKQHSDNYGEQEAGQNYIDDFPNEFEMGLRIVGGDISDRKNLPCPGSTPVRQI
jgi:hypothetical protein